ncbi:ATP synthase F1 subunit gamma [Clostridium fallax]|uniref:ATP synthase gamma chain n=1 Tax=Clostridium fallax TaxID=1533 RepID=A0A1M4VF40_9CLOT|nr:ATP synthase F1 subunit gamma [Clostridium fallax]SHE67577.1 F-type H+-transporting ATPase subunit gamma [Clostridium fallax]SQB05747.1 ATP synthase F0F1 subunit gamma [Clostridium fallax]
MAGAGLIEIKRRIKSVTNTRKITKAMGLVATSKLRRARMNLGVNNQYYTAIEKVARQLYSTLDDFNSNYYIKGNDSDKKLFIVIASDSGLCGGYNSNVAVGLSNYVKGDRANSLVMAVGQRGISYVKKYGFETIAEYVEIPDKPTIKEAKVIYEHALRLFREGEVGEVNVVYTRFNSPVSQEVKVERMLPISLEKAEVNQEYLIEPKADEVIGSTFDVYLKAKLINCMLQAKTSEQSARMTAMDGASKNADDLLDKLQTKYNRIRQSVITQEISEIVGGAEAQK